MTHSHKLILLMFSDQCWPIKSLRGKKQADIQNRSGAKLVISDECRPNSDEKDVIVSGSKHDVAYCIYLTCGVVLEVIIFISLIASSFMRFLIIVFNLY